MSNPLYVEASQVIEEMLRRKLTPPAALHPPGEEYPRIAGAEFHEERVNQGFFETPKLLVQWVKDGPLKPFFVTSNYGPGAVALVVVEEKILFVRQWRVNLGQKTEEVTRGFSESWDSGTATSLETLPKVVSSNLQVSTSANTALREASEETESDLSRVVPIYLGSLWQNSGTETNRPGFWLLNVEGYSLKDSPNVRLLTLEEAEDQAVDMHTMSALGMYRRYLRSRSC
jgi:8-oxo-dGTP pyrophosphatase MutT (NUDIX family)